VENPQFRQDNRPNTRGGLAPRRRGRGRGPPKLTNHKKRKHMNKDKNLRRENNTLEIKTNLQTSDYFKTKHSFTKCSKDFDESNGTVKKYTTQALYS
jgi:hypothetical protein